MLTSRLALKLTSPLGCTKYRQPGRTSRTLKRGMLVKRRAAGKLNACNAAAVHAYESLHQAKCNDATHCAHGWGGILWLVRLYTPRKIRGGSKLIGTSYKVLQQLGTLRAVDPLKVAKLLKGK